MNPHGQPIYLGLFTLLLITVMPSHAVAQFVEPAMESNIFSWTNQARQAQGKGPLRYNEKLAKAALLHAANMARQDTMSHNLDGESVADRARRATYASTYVGENIAFNFGYANPPWQLFDGWMKSPSHYVNIMKNEYTELGVGVVRTHEGKFYACQVFGNPQPQTIPYMVPQPPFGAWPSAIGPKFPREPIANPQPHVIPFVVSNSMNTYKMPYSAPSPQARSVTNQRPSGFQWYYVPDGDAFPDWPNMWAK